LGSSAIYYVYFEYYKIVDYKKIRKYKVVLI
jgi:hypothetical protein